ncbi:transporter substrate-binding domain-containing protein [Marinibaculum pumilum]|uniref:Transporter substrate-binding domain-containing protein n=1 Tax=Marinibaculum pumilum TaxID=1766165 RepID=A0ABV7KZ78_9PROT
MTDDILRRQLAPTGTLRAGINLSNFLLVTGRSPDGAPQGVAPDMAAAVAARLEVPVAYVTFDSPGQLADAAADDVWDIGLIGAEPQRAERIAFTTAYAEIEATFLVPDGSPITAIEQVDRPGIRIAVTGRAAYGLWLERNIARAELVRTDSLDSAYETFVAQRLDVLAGLRSRLLKDRDLLPGSRILDGHFATVQQAIGTHRRNAEAAAFLQTLVEELKAGGQVAALIERHGVGAGLSVAPPAGG